VKIPQRPARAKKGEAKLGGLERKPVSGDPKHEPFVSVRSKIKVNCGVPDPVNPWVDELNTCVNTVETGARTQGIPFPSWRANEVISEEERTSRGREYLKKKKGNPAKLSTGQTGRYRRRQRGA